MYCGYKRSQPKVPIPATNTNFKAVFVVVNYKSLYNVVLCVFCKFSQNMFTKGKIIHNPFKRNRQTPRAFNATWCNANHLPLLLLRGVFVWTNGFKSNPAQQTC
jgi:hypothetical protein